jgi:Ni/Co efflux regulator RcnB
MRKLLIGLLLAGAAATPALAGPHNDRQQAQEDRQAAHEDRVQAREDRQQARQESRVERAPNAQGEQFNPQQVQARQQAFAGGGGERFNGRPDRGNVQVQRGNNVYVAPGARSVTPPNQSARDRMQQMQQQRVEERTLRQGDRNYPNVTRDRHPPVVSNVPRPGTQPPPRTDNYRRGGNVHWDTNWRNNHHYDWHNYRDHHRSRFHLGFYIDPFSWGYQPFSIGYRMWPAYYGNQYWIDPAMYGLPYPPPGAAWVRYYNDVMLIDLYSGTVIDAIPGFFW